MLARFISAAAVTALLAGASAAAAKVTVTVAPNGLGSGPIQVISGDGTKWTKILASQLTLPVRALAGMSNHTFAEYGGAQYELFLGEKPLTLKNDSNPAVGTHTLAAKSADLSGIDRTKILALCNARLNVGKGINQDHNILGDVTVRIVGYFRRDRSGDAPDTGTPVLGPYQNTATVSVPVRCVGFARQPVEANMAAFKINEPPRRICVGGRVYSTRSMPPTFFCKCNATGWTPVPTGTHRWSCVNKRAGSKANKPQKSKFKPHNTQQRRAALKPAQSSANRHPGLQDSLNRRVTRMASPSANKRPKGLHDTLNRRATMMVAPTGNKSPGGLQDTLNKQTTMKAAPPGGIKRRTPPKRHFAPRRQTPTGSSPMMLRHRR